MVNEVCFFCQRKTRLATLLLLFPFVGFFVGPQLGSFTALLDEQIDSVVAAVGVSSQPYYLQSSSSRNASRNNHAQDEASIDKVLAEPSDEVASDVAAVAAAAPSFQLRQIDYNNTHPPPNHPHLGAADSNGVIGFVHNPRFHRQVPRPLQIQTPQERSAVCAPFGKGLERKEGYHALRRIATAIAQSQRDTEASGRSGRIFCVVYTHAPQQNNVTSAILETWAKRCDGFLFASTVTNETSQHVHIPHGGKHPGKYGGMWQRVRSILGYLYDNFRNDNDFFDFFHLCGDDTFLIVEHLRAFLVSDKVATFTQEGEKPLYAGFWMIDPWMQKQKPANGEPPRPFYLGGGSGYTINRAALKLIVEKGLPKKCYPKRDVATEDVQVAHCFRMLNITGFDTRDSVGAHRYHQLDAYQHALIPKKRLGTMAFVVRRSIEVMEEDYGITAVWGQEYISTTSVAFHKIKGPEGQKRYEVLLYRSSYDQVCGANKNNNNKTDAKVTKT